MTRGVYVRLLGEGTHVFRPTSAEVISDSTVRLLPVADVTRDDEEWEFSPGAAVRVEARVLEGQQVLVAVSLAG